MVLSELLRQKISKRILQENQRKKNLKEFENCFSICFCNYKIEKNINFAIKDNLCETYNISDLIKGPLGSTNHLKLQPTKQKNVNASKNCENNLELMLNISFSDQKSFSLFKDNLFNKDFIGIETKKYFLREFIIDETSKHLKLFENELILKDNNSKGFSNNFKFYHDKNEICQNSKNKFYENSQDENYNTQMFNLDDTHKQYSNQILFESNFLLFNESMKNSIGFPKNNDSQFLGFDGKVTPGKLGMGEELLNSRGINPISSIHINSFKKQTSNKFRNNQSPFKKIPKLENENKKQNKTKIFRDIKSIKGNLLLEKDFSNLIFMNEGVSKGFELTQKEIANDLSLKCLTKRESPILEDEKLNSNHDTPIYNFKNVTKKIYEVENLNKIKKKDKKEKSLLDDSKKLFYNESIDVSKKENASKLSQKIKINKHFENETEINNAGNISNSVNTKKSTKKYEEGLLNLYSKV